MGSNQSAIHAAGEDARDNETSKNGFAARWQMEQMQKKRNNKLNILKKGGPDGTKETNNLVGISLNGGKWRQQKGGLMFNTGGKKVIFLAGVKHTL